MTVIETNLALVIWSEPPAADNEHREEAPPLPEVDAAEGDHQLPYDDEPFDEEDFSGAYIEAADGGPYYAEVVCPCRLDREAVWDVGPGPSG